MCVLAGQNSGIRPANSEQKPLQHQQTSTVPSTVLRPTLVQFVQLYRAVPRLRRYVLYHPLFAVRLSYCSEFRTVSARTHSPRVAGGRRRARLSLTIPKQRVHARRRVRRRVRRRGAPPAAPCTRLVGQGGGSRPAGGGAATKIAQRSAQRGRSPMVERAAHHSWRTSACQRSSSTRSLRTAPSPGRWAEASRSWKRNEDPTTKRGLQSLSWRCASPAGCHQKSERQRQRQMSTVESIARGRASTREMRAGRAGLQTARSGRRTAYG